MSKKIKKKIEYRSYSFRLNDETYKTLKKMRNKYDKSWNLFFYNNLIKKDETTKGKSI